MSLASRRRKKVLGIACRAGDGQHARSALCQEFKDSPPADPQTPSGGGKGVQIIPIGGIEKETNINLARPAPMTKRREKRGFSECSAKTLKHKKNELSALNRSVERKKQTK